MRVELITQPKHIPGAYRAQRATAVHFARTTCKAILPIVLCAIAGILGVKVFATTHSTVFALTVASVFVAVFLYTAFKDSQAD